MRELDPPGIVQVSQVAPYTDDLTTTHRGIITTSVELRFSPQVIVPVVAPVPQQVVLGHSEYESDSSSLDLVVSSTTSHKPIYTEYRGVKKSPSQSVDGIETIYSDQTSVNKGSPSGVNCIDAQVCSEMLPDSSAVICTDNPHHPSKVQSQNTSELILSPDSLGKQ